MAGKITFLLVILVVILTSFTQIRSETCTFTRTPDTAGLGDGTYKGVKNLDECEEACRVDSSCVAIYQQPPICYFTRDEQTSPRTGTTHSLKVCTQDTYTSEPTTSEPTTPEPTTPEPTTPEPTTPEPTTTEPTTPKPTTPEPTTPEPTTPEPTTPKPITPEPTTPEPTTPEPTTPEPTTPKPTTPEPTTTEPTTPKPTTPEPTTPEPTTPEPTTPEPTTLEPTTPEPTTPKPTTPKPTTPKPTTPEPTTPKQTTPKQTTPKQTTPKQTTPEPTTPEPATSGSNTGGSQPEICIMRRKENKTGGNDVYYKLELSSVSCLDLCRVVDDCQSVSIATTSCRFYTDVTNTTTLLDSLHYVKTQCNNGRKCCWETKIHSKSDETPAFIFDNTLDSCETLCEKFLRCSGVKWSDNICYIYVNNPVLTLESNSVFSEKICSAGGHAGNLTFSSICSEKNGGIRLTTDFIYYFSVSLFSFFRLKFC